MSDIQVFVEEADGSTTAHSFPTDMGLNLMEALKGSEYPILATCGGIALCGTCHIALLEGTANPPSDEELIKMDVTNVCVTRYTAKNHNNIIITD